LMVRFRVPASGPPFNEAVEILLTEPKVPSILKRLTSVSDIIIYLLWSLLKITNGNI
jgi:hypothetical protein